MPLQMNPGEAASLFRQAEQAFAAGRLQAARTDLARLGGGEAADPAVLHLHALVEKKLGNVAAAHAAFEKALRLIPDDPAINSNFANLLEAAGERDQALDHYDRALSADPHFDNARFAKALLLQRSGQLAEALAEMDRLIARCPSEPRFHSARAGILRDGGDLAGAAAAYDQALHLDPARPVALHGRARVALELGSSDAVDRYRSALGKGVASAEVHLGLAQALEADGRAHEALLHLEGLLAAQPGWVEGHALAARIRWEAGDQHGYADGLEQLVNEAPGNREAWIALIGTYGGADFFARAADAAARGHVANPDAADLALLAALYHSEAGELASADHYFEQVPASTPGRSLHWASHLLRRKDYLQAAAALDEERALDPTSIAAWAMTAVTWRLIDDERAEWLSGQPGLVASASLDLSGEELAAIADCFRSLHQTRAHPLGQSLRGGTQTRGRLFERREREVQQLRRAIEEQVELYWRALPPADPGHPLLRHRERRPVLDGSWSVRLTDGGFHVAHMHTRGVLSSATYLVLPPAGEAMEGWLEIGGAPANLHLPLEPLHRIEPQVGRLALFPSYLFHGTRPFTRGERLTAAFDVIAR